MGQRDDLYNLKDIIEFDEAYISVATEPKTTAKRGKEVKKAFSPMIIFFFQYQLLDVTKADLLIRKRLIFAVYWNYLVFVKNTYEKT